MIGDTLLNAAKRTRTWAFVGAGVGGGLISLAACASPVQNPSGHFCGSIRTDTYGTSEVTATGLDGNVIGAAYQRTNSYYGYDQGTMSLWYVDSPSYNEQVPLAPDLGDSNPTYPFASDLDGVTVVYAPNLASGYGAPNTFDVFAPSCATPYRTASTLPAPPVVGTHMSPRS
jgi:hypothetical protein